MKIIHYQHEPSLWAKILKWYETTQTQAPTEDYLVPGTAYLVEHHGEPIVMFSVFLTTAPIIWWEGLIANPLVSQFTIGKALKEIQFFLEGLAKRAGKKGIWCMSIRGYTNSLFEKMGFVPCASGITSYYKEIQ
jgi:hypothetical protein